MLRLAAGFWLALCGFASAQIGQAAHFVVPAASAALACSYTPVTTGTQGTAYTGATPSASGGTPAYTFSETGTLPGGLSINSSTGIISGTPTASGSFPTIQVKVTDSTSTVANCGASFTLVIAAPGCSQATAFLARTSGLSGTESGAYTTLICGMVTDGTFSLVDALYVFATNTTTTANLNLISTSFPITVHGSPTFTADVGYTGDGTAAYLDTTFVPSTAGGNYTQNAASFGVCVLNNRGTGSFADIDMSTNPGGSRIGVSLVAPFVPSGLGSQLSINETAGGFFGTTATSQGSWIAVRNSSTAELLFLNGSSYGSQTNASTGLSTTSFDVLADPGDSSFSTDQVGYAFIGGVLTSGQVSSIRSRLSAYQTAVGSSGC